MDAGVVVLTVPPEADEFTAFALRDDGKELVITILQSMGIEQAHALKEINNS